MSDKDLKKLRPRRDHVIVETELPAKKVGALFIPDSANEEPPTEGIVVSAGPLAHEVKPGQRCWFREGSGTQLAETLHILEEVEILVVEDG